ncbi:hypothetical protein HO173_012985 [Letharia columbiana]|uniref:Uncharacterized protein n=1 Tax=Letharia columbiana TaxID=112416 RepID=A0A8H6CJG1_9LECA|nr:uncharacterized protein HO173_012985 [Letharia columbiana]KAF6224642.1 hypothetical protein HO173_012985 [Letharia columbiana]
MESMRFRPDAVKQHRYEKFCALEHKTGTISHAITAEASSNSASKYISSTSAKSFPPACWVHVCKITLKQLTTCGETTHGGSRTATTGEACTASS